MAKIFCINDYEFYADMVARALEARTGHECHVALAPFDLTEILNFAPDLITVNLVRKPEALRSALHDFEREVEGARPLQALLKAMPEHERLRVPLILTALAVLESELPPGIAYQAFVEIPRGLSELPGIIDRLLGSEGAVVPK